MTHLEKTILFLCLKWTGIFVIFYLKNAVLVEFISRTPGGKPEVVFSLNESLSKPSGAPGEQVTVPKEHKFVMTGITSQQLSVLAQHPHTGLLL